MVTGKRFLFLAATMVVLLGTAGILSALNAEYNRPNPLMDYVPQEAGIYDTGYWNLAESNCRECHGDTLANRHHLSETVLVYGLCTPCHTLDPNAPGGVVVTRDCTTSGCHSWNDVLTQPNGWHHDTNLSGSENCIACHDPAIVAPIDNFRDFEMYPPSVATPTPFSCENCHWEQAYVTYGWMVGDPDPTYANAGHPSDYNHYDMWGGGPMYWEYGKEILGNPDTHHMGSKGNVQSQCWKCHSMDPNDPDWDENNPELIRYCEICHSVYTLHTIYGHIQDTEAWIASGFHVPGSPYNNPDDYREFTVYDGDPPDGPPDNPLETDEICFGCHADQIDDPAPTPDPCVAPTIDSVNPMSITCEAIVTIRGSEFGEEMYPESKVELALSPPETTWVEMPVYSWTDTKIEFRVPCWTLATGVYKMKVTNGCGLSAAKFKIDLGGWISLTSLTPDSGPCGSGQWITLNGGNFGSARTETYTAGGKQWGVQRTVELVSSQYPVPLVAKNYQNWSNTSVEFKMYNFFEDDYEDASFFGDDIARRNHIQDLSEAEAKKCTGLTLGPYEVYAVATYFEDVDTSGTLNTGDIITEVVTSDPEIYELTDEPYINALNPNSIVPPTVANPTPVRVKVLGLNFGPMQYEGDEVRFGKKKHYNTDPLTKGKKLKVVDWSNTRIKVKLTDAKIPDTWHGTNRYIWVVKDGVASNKKRIQILSP